MKVAIRQRKGVVTHQIAIAINADQKMVGNARRIELVKYDQMSDITFDVEGITVPARVIIHIYAKPGQRLSERIMRNRALRLIKEGQAILT